MERHTQTLTMVHTSYIKTFILLIGITMSPLANAKNIISTSNFFHKNILHLKTNTLAQLNASAMSPLKIEDMVDLSSDFNLNLSDEDVAEICDNGIDDDGDGLVDCFDPDCSDFCITGNLSRSWEVWIRLHNKRSWAEWSALGRSFYASSAGGNCSANHTTWNYYETDETASRWYGTPGSF